MVGLVCRFLRLWGRAATLQSVRLLVLLLQHRVLWSKAATATLQAVQLLSLLLQHKRCKRFQQGAATWLLVLLLGHKRRKLLQLGAATRQLILLLRHKLHRPWVAVARLYRSPTRVPLVPFTMVAACVHRAGGHRGEDGFRVPHAMRFGRRSQMACGLGRGDSRMHRAVRGVPWLNWPVAN